MSRLLAMLVGRRLASPAIDMPSHTAGTHKGEEWVIHNGREPGRGSSKAHRTARDSTGINPQHHGPVDPRMPHIPPA